MTRVLVASDAPMVVGILAHKLRREGYDVVTAPCNAAVVFALDAASFECILCDLQLLERMSGRVTPDERDSRSSRAAPPETTFSNCLAIVEGRDDDAAARAMQLGAAGVVRTPFKPTAVAEQVATLLRIREVAV